MPREGNRHQSTIDAGNQDGAWVKSERTRKVERGKRREPIRLHEATPAAGLAVHEQSARMMPEGAITVVDDDESIRDSLPALLQSYGYQASAFESAEAFLEAGEAERTACIILDVAMPGMSGPELQQALSTSGYRIPIIFISARSQDEIWPRLQASGAIACLLKPFSERAMLDAVRLAFDDSRSS